MKLKLTLLACMLMFCLDSQAQYNLKENNVWAFGFNAGLDFNSGVPVPITTAFDYNGYAEPEGCASVCDTGGRLLFYTAGDSIWNGNYVVMPNGFALTPVPYNTPCSFTNGSDTSIAYAYTTSSSQSAVIIPVLSNPNQYYVFTLQNVCFGDAAAGRLYYSIVDMTLDGGKGDVITSKRGILIDSQLSEKMISIAGDNCDMWLLVHGGQNDTFRAYNITAAGINPTPVISVTGNITGILVYDIGTLKVSPNRRKLALGSVGFFGSGGVGGELYDFDPATGKVSNAVTMTQDLVYGISFSPDNTKLYLNQISVDATTSDINLYLAQYDVSLPTTTAILNSRVNLMTQPGSAQIKDIRLGPDGKMYMAGVSDNQDLDSLDVIDYPNLAGTACHYVPNAFAVATNTQISQGLPNIYNKPLRDTIHATIDTNLTAAHNLPLQIPSGYFSYRWNDGDTSASKTITQAGTYWVSYGNYCVYRIDTFVVGFPAGITTVSNAPAVQMAVYPNPAHSSITVAVNGMDKVSGTLRITDAIGRVQLQQTITTPKQIIDVSKFAAGIYNVEYIDDNNLHSQCRMVVTK